MKPLIADIAQRFASTESGTGSICNDGLIRHSGEPQIEREQIVLAAMPELQLTIVELAREHGRVTMGEAIKLTRASRNTLKQHFRALVERSTLNRYGSGRGVWYERR